MKTVRADTLGEDVRERMGAIFIDGYYQMGLQLISRDRERLARAYRHMFKLDMYYLAVDEGGEIWGMAACTDGHTPSVEVDGAQLREHLGPLRGRIAAPLSKSFFERTDTPFPFTPGMANVEFVATAAGGRGKGVATGLIRDMIAATPYTEYVLDVADTNVPAVKAYERVGFAEFLRVSQWPVITRRMGVNAFVYMKYVKEA